VVGVGKVTSNLFFSFFASNSSSDDTGQSGTRGGTRARDEAVGLGEQSVHVSRKDVRRWNEIAKGRGKIITKP